MLSCYYMDISCNCSYEQIEDLKKVISEERLEKIARLRNRDKVKKQILASAFLQYGLSDALGIPIQEIRYVYGEYGKPGIVYNGKDMRGKIDFNLSHSGNYAVLAVSDRLVGIDVEKRADNMAAVAKRFFCKEEYQDILNGHGGEKKSRFLEYWTMKEAYVKRTGRGLYTPLNSFLIKRREQEVSFAEQEAVYFATFFFAEKMYCVSVCSEYKEELEKLSKNDMKEITLAQIMNRNNEKVS